MRKTYRFSHSVRQGGYLYIHKSDVDIKKKNGLRNALNAIAKKYELIDCTIKIYDGLFFLFFMRKPGIKPDELIRCIHKNIQIFGDWDKDYILTNVYDLQEGYVRKDLEKLGFDYDDG